MGYGAAAHVSFVYMLYHMDVIRVPKEVSPPAFTLYQAQWLLALKYSF